jgi:fermentation-respiration switch protein FrsA (DUF1100 family)
MKPSNTAAGLSLLNAFAMAQNMSYGADNFYQSSNVTVWPVTFPTQFQSIIAGNLFLPNDLDTTILHPGLIVGHPMGATKEQSANLYATKLAEQTSFVTLSIDLPTWGASSGHPRNAAAPELFAEAFSAAVDFLVSKEYINASRIGALGICGSGSFVISAAKIDPRIAAVATSSMYDMGAVARNGLRNAQSLEQRKEITAAAAAQRSAEADGSPTAYVPGTVLRLEPNSTDVEREFYDYYRTPRGLFTPGNSMPNITTQPTQSSQVKFQNFYPLNDINVISPRPMLFVAGDQSHSREFSEDAFAAAGEPKELFWVEGAGHVDLYDRVELIPFEKLTEFFLGSLY